MSLLAGMVCSLFKWSSDCEIFLLFILIIGIKVLFIYMIIMNNLLVRKKKLYDKKFIKCNAKNRVGIRV